MRRLANRAALLLSLAAATAARGTDRDLAREIERFGNSPAASGLSYGVVFRGLEQPAGDPDPRSGNHGLDDAAPGGLAVNPETPLIPASVMKLATTITALERLGPAHTFLTELWTSGNLRGDTLEGDLYIRGGGDPFLVSERLWLLAAQVRQLGLRRVTGRLVLDRSRFSPPFQDPARSASREVSQRPYGARLSALAVNFNAAAIRVSAGAAAGSPALVEADPLPCAYISIDNRLRTLAPGERAAWDAQLVPAAGGEVFRVTGTIARAASPTEAGQGEVVYRSVRDPDAFSLSLTEAFLREAGVIIEGGTAQDTLPAGARLLLSFPSLTVQELVAKINRFSNNLMTDMLAMAIPARETASLEAAAAEIAAHLRSSHGAGDGVRIVDGSGLSAGNRLTAGLVAHLLQAAWSDLDVLPALLGSLPGPGEDGTLRRRFKSERLPLRAKTGTMNDQPASSLAGYLQDAEGRTIAFAMLMNAPPGGSWTVPRMQDLQEQWVRIYLRPAP